MTVYISNAFSLSMLTGPATIKVFEVTVFDVKDIIKDGFVSAIGHEVTAKIISTQLGVQVPVNRISIKLQVATYLCFTSYLQGFQKEKVLNEEEMKQVQAKWYVCFVAPF